jgi:hypothetical protein
LAALCVGVPTASIAISRLQVNICGKIRKLFTLKNATEMFD